MGVDNFIQTAMNNVLKNPILSILRDINFSSILKQSNFIKRDIGKSPYLVILHFLYMFVINRKISSFMKYSNDSYKKDVYYRLLKDNRYNWRKLLLLTSVKLICKLHKLQKTTDTKVLIIDDTVEIKRGKFIEGSCKNLWSNKEHRTVKGLNIVSLNYSDCYTDMMLDFSINYNKNQIVNVDENSFHHKSNAYKRRFEGNDGKNILALDMLQRVLKLGIYADYLLVDSWYAKPDFINTVQTNGLNVIARIANNPRIWQFVGKHNTLESLYTQAKKQKTSKFGNYNTIKTYHKDSWIKDEYINIITQINKIYNQNKDFKFYSAELVEKETNLLISGEIGYQVGSTYTSLTGFTTKDKKYNNCGKLQLVLLNYYLKENNFKLWNLGHPQLQYKIDLGAKVYNRKDFLKLWKDNL